VGGLRLSAALILFILVAGTASAQSTDGRPTLQSPGIHDQHDQDGHSRPPDLPPAEAAPSELQPPEVPDANQPAADEFTNSPLVTRGSVRGGGTYFLENTRSPLSPLVAGQSSGLGRLIVNIKPEYKPFGERKLTIGADATAIVSKQEGTRLSGDSLDLFVSEAYADFQTNRFRLSAGKRNALHSVGYFRYPLDFYDTSSLVTTGAEDPRRVVETRNGPLFGSAERRWDWGSASVEYLPKLAGNHRLDWHSNGQQQIIGRSSFVRSGVAMNLAVERVIGREPGRDVDGKPLRARDLTEFGASSTYVIGSSLELHAEGSFRRDQQLPRAAVRNVRFTTPFEMAVPLPVWTAGPKANLVEILAGAQYTFGDRTILDGWNVILEYDYQSEGWTRSQWNRFFDQVSRLQRINELAAGSNPFKSQIERVAGAFASQTAELFRARPAFWGRHLGFVRVSHIDFLVDALEVAAYTIPSLQDGSFVAGANLVYEPRGGFQLRVDARYLGGPGRSEFGRSPNRLLMQVEVGYGF
jgi:hypothetical protein